MGLRFRLAIDYYIGSLLHVFLKPLNLLLGKLLSRDHDLRKCSSVTIIKMLGGGSLVIAYPALLAIKNAPNVRSLRLLTTPGVRPFAECLGIFDEIIVIRDQSLLGLGLDSMRALRILFRCDAIVDLEIHSRLTTVFAVFACARNRIGFYTGNSFWRKGLSTHLLFCNISTGIYHFYDQIAEMFGGTVPDLGAAKSLFRASLGPVGAVPDDNLRLALSPCCSDLSKERMLRHDEWLAILERRLGRDGTSRKFEIHLFGAPRDRPSLEELAALIRDKFSNPSIFNHAGETSLRESVQILSTVHEQLCIDSALLHFGRLLGIKTVSYWGPTSPASLLRPWRNGQDEVHYVQLPCSPCVHLAQEAPCRGNNICMRLAVNPNLPHDANPAWMIADDRVTRFARPGGP